MAYSYAYEVHPDGNPLSFVNVEDMAADGMEAANAENFAGIEASNLVDASIIAQIRETLLRSKLGPLIQNGVPSVDAIIADALQAQIDAQKAEILNEFASASFPASSSTRHDSHVELSAIDEVKAVLAQRMPLPLAERAAQAVVREVLSAVTSKRGRNTRQRVAQVTDHALSLAA